MWDAIKEDLNNIQNKDPAARSKIEIFFTYPGLWSIWFYRIAHFFWRKKFKFIARIISNLARFLTGIEIHPGATIGKRFFIDHGMGVVIGETVEIGDDCTVYQGVTLGGTSLVKEKRHPTLKNSVIIGAGAKVLGPILLGDHVKIGSNAVVTKDIPDYHTAVGIPAKTIKNRQNLSEEIACKLFTAYGVNNDMPDPEALAINHLLDHIQLLDKALNDLKQELTDKNIEIKTQIPKKIDKDLL